MTQQPGVNTMQLETHLETDPRWRDRGGLGLPLGLLTGLALAAGCSAEPAGAARVDFRGAVEPIFLKRCTVCHGPDTQKSGLRLDRKQDAFRGGKSGKAPIVPGQSAASPLLARVTSSDPDEAMPPKGERLTSEQTAALKLWIDQGADWPDNDPRKHWSFLPPARPGRPPVRNSRWPRNPIDHFILARLEQEGLAPSPEADRPTLIRRLSLDLTGLPPTPGEVEAFLRDRSPGAYERVADRLLASPHLGENVGRWWLDLARYADSNGYQVDLARSIWPYRDWVIGAFNRNQPFDQFTVEQLAGDLLPNATLEQRIATGFNRNSKINDEGGGDAEEYRTKAVKDRVGTVATTWLGLTMTCAECHSHKYDPISHEEYYRFYAFFNNTTDGGNNSLEPTTPVPAPPVQPQVAYFRGQLDKVRRQLADAEQNLPREQEAWERRLAGKTNVWTPLEITKAVSTGGATYTNLPDHSILATGVNPVYDTILLEAETFVTGITAVLLEVLPDPSLPKHGPGRWDQSGNFILDEFALWAAPASARRDLPARANGATAAEATSGTDASELTGAGSPAPGAANVFFARATADWEQEHYRAEHAIDRNPKTGWAIGPRFGQPHFLIAEVKEPVGFSQGTRLGFRFEHYHGNNHTLGRLRLSVTAEKDPEARWPLPEGMADLLAVPAGQRTPEQRRQLAAHYRGVSPAIRRLERELFRLNQLEAGLAAQRYSTPVMQERAEPRESYIHLRGNFLDHGKVVTPGVLEVLPPLPPNQPLNRLTLARWLVDPAHPLTARVTVNRFWERVFGTGLVKTSEDFGRQGELPSHPELLDWLAREFIEPTVPDYPAPTGEKSAVGRPQAWNVKHLLRLLVTSATYRQDSAASATLLEKDLYNRLLARGPRFRLDGEVIRDQALAVSGLLNRDLGGPSVYPVQMANLWKEIGFLRPEIGMDEWPTSLGLDLYRRGVYTFWRRVCTYPPFATFDAPSREVCMARRPRTNTPLQALAGLNEPTLCEAARVFAQRIMLEGGGTAAAQVDFAVRVCLARPPTPAERSRLLSLLAQQVRGFERDPQAAQALLAVGAAERPPQCDPRRLAAWTIVANVLLNLDETLTKG